MKTVSRRTQLWLIGLGYGAVITVSAGLLFVRYLVEITHPADVAAAGGMYAFGDAMLWLFIASLFMIPTFFAVWFMASVEHFYKAYSQVLLALSLSAPVCLVLLCWGENHVARVLGFLSLYRLMWSPFILVGIGVSRFFARFDSAKKLTTYALLIEGLTLGAGIAILLKHR